jgi:hypothetical protein
MRLVPGEEAEVLIRRHLRWGWCALLAFLSLGIVLEAFHGFKVDWYMSVASDTRRLLWRLAHAHGTLLGLVNLAFAFTLREAELAPKRAARLASAALMGATLLLPLGFLLGGWVIHSGDPSRAILLVPAGALLLLLSVGWIAGRLLRTRD